MLAVSQSGRGLLRKKPCVAKSVSCGYGAGGNHEAGDSSHFAELLCNASFGIGCRFFYSKAPFGPCRNDDDHPVSAGHGI